MRLFAIVFCLTAVLTASSAFAGSDEPLTGGTPLPRSARFDATEAQQYLVAKARSDAMHRQSILNHYDWTGVNFGRPTINAGVFFLAEPPARVRRITMFPSAYVDARGYGF
jgi:hypothetical protein